MKTYTPLPSPLLLHTRHFHNTIMYTIKYSMVQIANNPSPFGEIFSRPFLWFCECSSSPKKFGVSWTEIPKSRRKDCLSVKVKRAYVASLGKKLLTRTLSLARQDNFSVFPKSIKSSWFNMSIELKNKCTRHKSVVLQTKKMFLWGF